MATMLYFADVISAIGTTFMFIAVVCLAAALGCVIHHDTRSDIDFARRARHFFIGFMVLVALGAFFPGKQTLYMMAVAHYVEQNSDEIKAKSLPIIEKMVTDFLNKEEHTQ